MFYTILIQVWKWRVADKKALPKQQVIKPRLKRINPNNMRTKICDPCKAEGRLAEATHSMGFKSQISGTLKLDVCKLHAEQFKKFNEADFRAAAELVNKKLLGIPTDGKGLDVVMN